VQKQIRRNDAGNQALRVRAYHYLSGPLDDEQGSGNSGGIVITTAFVYLILDTRDDLKLVKTELRQLQDLEKQLAVLLGD
jgi:hypothetical protein